MAARAARIGLRVDGRETFFGSHAEARVSVNLVASLLCSLAFWVGCASLCDALVPGLRLWPRAARAFVGFLPLFAVQCVVQFLEWRAPETSSAAGALIATLRWLFVGFGVLAVVRGHVARPTRQHLAFTAAAALLFAPALVAWSGFHPSWDSDALFFWLPRAKAYTVRGFLAAGDAAHADYVGLMPALVGSSLPKFLSPAHFVTAYRLVSFAAFLNIFFALTDNLRSGWRLRACALVLLASGFPLKIINGYQDYWCALFALLAMTHVRRDARDVTTWVWALVVLAGLKNEGILFALILGAGFAWYARPSWNRATFTALAGFAVVLSWKVFARNLNLENRDLALHSPDIAEWFARWGTYAAKFGSALQRRFQSFALDGALGAWILWLHRSRLNTIDRLFVVQALLCLLAPLVVISFTPYDFAYHMDTTFSRVTMTGCLMFVGLAVSAIDRVLADQRANVHSAS